LTDTIMNCFSAVVSLIAFSVLYVFVMAWVAPYFLLTPSYKRPLSKDTGIQKYKFPEGRGIVCKPNAIYRKYLKKYVVFLYQNHKYLKCKLSEDVVSIRYEVAVYNNDNKLIKILDLEQNLETKGETDSVLLPDNTAYVNVILKAINEKESFFSLKKTSFIKLAIFSSLAIALTIAYGLLARTAVLSLSDLLNLQWDIKVGMNLIISSVVGVLIALCYMAIHKKQIFGKKQ